DSSSSGRPTGRWPCTRSRTTASSSRHHGRMSIGGYWSSSRRIFGSNEFGSGSGSVFGIGSREQRERRERKRERKPIVPAPAHDNAPDPAPEFVQVSLTPELRIHQTDMQRAPAGQHLL